MLFKNCIFIKNFLFDDIFNKISHNFLKMSLCEQTKQTCVPNIKSSQDNCSCIRCPRRFLISFGTTLHFQEDERFWFLVGNNISNPRFCIEQAEKLSNLAQGKLLCDECVAILCRQHIVRFVGDSYCVPDPILYDKISENF